MGHMDSHFLSSEAWYNQLETAVPVEERIDGWSMAEHQHQVCKTDLTGVQSCIRFIVEFDERLPCPVKIPPFFPLDRLAKVYPTQKMVQINAAKVKCSILHALAFLSWWTTVIVTWEKNLSDGAVSIISSLLSTVKVKRGVTCNLERDWSTINLPLYIQHSVPLFYLWNFEARADNHFSRLNPALNLTYWAVRQGTALSLAPDIEEEDLNKIARQAIKLNHFFQEAFTYRSVNDPSILPTYTFFIIDFKGWKCRLIKYDKTTLTSLAKLYYYGVLHEDDDGSYKTIVFWRWRKHEPKDDYLRCQFKVSLPSEEHAGTIRELYKFDYRPRPGVAYDIKMGLITGSKKQASNTASLLQWLSIPSNDTNKLLQECLSVTIQSEMSVDEQSDSINDGPIRFSEVPDTLYHPQAVNSPAAWIHCNDELLATA